MNFAVEGGWREVKLVRDQRVDVGPTASLWRVSFNLTGTTLAVSPENGAVTLWRADPEKGWVEIDLREN